jgi:hypothetical protein
MFEHLASIEGWIDVDTLNLFGELLLQSLKREQVVAIDEPVVKNVLVAYSLFRVVAFLTVFKQDSRL